MKTEEQIRQWVKTHEIHENDVYSIMGYLTALNIDIENDIIIDPRAKVERFNDFVDWFENDIESNKEMSKLISKYKIGDIVRVEESTTCRIITDIISIGYTIKYMCRVSKYNHYTLCDEQDLELVDPKEGEFWYVKTTKNREYIYCKQGENSITSNRYSMGLTVNQIANNKDYLCYDHQISELRPATEQEKQQLIKTIEITYNKTFDGKEWVVMKPVFKNGDYIYTKPDYAKPVIGIYNESLSKNRGCGLTCGYQINLIVKPYICNEYYPIDIFSHATEQQKAELDNKLAEEGKRYNPKTFELEDILKVGDLVIAWDDESSAVIGKIHTIDNSDAYPFQVLNGYCFQNAIKWDGTKEQYERMLVVGKML